MNVNDDLEKKLIGFTFSSRILNQTEQYSVPSESRSHILVQIFVRTTSVI
jgi:hypothetical protein